MKYVPPLAGPPLAPNTLGVRGQITLRLIERPDATTDAASGRFPALHLAPRRPEFSTRPNQ